MKKLIFILCFYTVFCALACICGGFFLSNVPNLLPAYVFKYKIFNGLLFFLNVLPAVIFTGITIGCSVAFGQNSSGSEERFSIAMLRRYKVVLIVGLICVLFLTATTEIFTPIITSAQSSYKSMPGMVSDYVRIANSLCESDQYQLARQYGQLALNMDSESKEAHALMERIDIELSQNRLPSVPRTLTKRSGTMSAAESAASTYELLRRAQEAKKANDWFSVHYFASEGLATASERDLNRQTLMELSAEAWNVLSAPRSSDSSEENKLFAMKFEGYTALMNGDNLHAYYVFRTLEQTSRELSVDPDISRYVNLAEERVMNECFFMDEEIFMRNYESATDIYFALKPKNPDDDTKIVYIKGISGVPGSGGFVQYLRSLFIFNVDSEGRYKRGLYVPYAKLMETDVSNFTDDIKMQFNIPLEIDYVPEILLRSIDRDDENIYITPSYYYADSNEVTGNDLMFLPVSFSDYMLVVEASQGAENMTLGSLYSFIPKSKEFGYAQEIFSQVLIDRAIYPFFMLFFVIFLASYAWNNRIDGDTLFKFKWIFTFPIFTFFFHFLYQLLLWVFKLQNYAVLATVGDKAALVLCAIFYVLLFIIATVVFLSRNNASED